MMMMWMMSGIVMMMISSALIAMRNHMAIAKNAIVARTVVDVTLMKTGAWQTLTQSLNS
jgi:hypothetical protein